MQIELFSGLLSHYAQSESPCKIAMGYRSLYMKIINDFLFSSIPPHLKSLANDKFDDPLSVSSTAAVNWTLWLLRNFPSTGYMFHLPDWILKRFPYSFESRREVGQVSAALATVTVKW